MNCTLLCVLLKYSRRIIVCEKSPEWIRFVREYYSDALVTEPEVCRDFALHHSDRGRADAALEAAGAVDTLRLPWECVRPKVVVTAVAFYDRPQTLLLADMYGKNLTFCIGGMDGCDCADRTGQDRHHAAHYAPLSIEPDRGGIPPFRKPAGRSILLGKRGTNLYPRLQ